ncbi:ribbon-helix-helix domain-containing protein [Weizmannia sp. FSL W8-0676]|uniref:ribbon-helix-helix domain-containing protein n=1 Tax=Heyndrickxia TaxID=2837504 RepID=UPI002236A6CD|nr:ribbon-helix-helix domain-containing protein [Heyndrickxia coagulans]UZH07682.1 ribbon-helix-helix domain-containing protein [Heyndrickxia coagulans]
MREEKERVEIRMPKTILEKLEQYQKENGIPTRKAAILELLRKRIGKITLAKANRNSSPTYSLVRFAPPHSLRMGDFFRKAVKKHFQPRITPFVPRQSCS